MHEQRSIFGFALGTTGVRAFAGAVLLVVVATAGCGGGSNSGAQTAPLSGNWEITLTPHGSTAALTYTGFLMQTGSSVSGSVILRDGCSGVGPVTGTITGQNLTLNINEFGQDVSLNGSLNSGGGPMTGQFSTLAGGCTGVASTGTWSAVEVAPLKGTFHGTMSSSNNGTLNITGVMDQGPNIGGSTATLSGTIAATGTVTCNYLTNATITGVISGTSVDLNLYGPNGSLIGLIPSSAQPAVVAPDGSLLTAGYTFSRQSGSCFGDTGSLLISFP